MKIRTKSAEILDLAELRKVAKSFNRANALSVDYEQIAADFLALLDALEAVLEAARSVPRTIYAQRDLLLRVYEAAGVVQEEETA